MKPELLQTQIAAVFPDVPTKIVRESLLLENPADLPRVASVLREDPELALDYLSSVTGSDYVDYLESVYHFYSMTKKTGPAILRVRVKKDYPHVPSLYKHFRSAELQERESYDLFGIIYDGHPDLRRILMWEGFEGFPMRKDFVQENSELLDEEDKKWLEAHQVRVPAESAPPAEASQPQPPAAE